MKINGNRILERRGYINKYNWTFYKKNLVKYIGFSYVLCHFKFGPANYSWDGGENQKQKVYTLQHIVSELLFGR
jgi:hypothetical protein